MDILVTYFSLFTFTVDKFKVEFHRMYISSVYQISLKMAMRKKRKMFQYSPARVDKRNSLGSLLAVKIIYVSKHCLKFSVLYVFKDYKVLFPVTDNS